MKRLEVIPFRVACLCAVLAMMLSSGQAQQLPIKTYTTDDGLAHNVVHRVLCDSHGFLWFGTREGLSRFDGYSFTNYGIEQGLPSAIVNDLLETHEGVYWVATAGGLCRFNPLGRAQARINNAGERRQAAANAMFTVYFPGEDARSQYVLTLLQDRTGIIWCGTPNGLYRVDGAPDRAKIATVDLGIPDHFESRFINCLLEDRAGALWVGAERGLYRRFPDGRIEAYTTRDGLPNPLIRSLLEDREGRIWVGTWGGLFRLVPDPAPGRNVVARAYSDKDGMSAANLIIRLFQASDGSLWAGSNAGLIQFIPTADGRDFRFRAYAEAHGFGFHEVTSLAEDRNGNLWVGIVVGGVAKIARGGFTTFGKADGFFWSTSIFETGTGDLCVAVTRSADRWFINRFDGEKFIPIRPQFPEIVKKSGYGWGWNQTALQDHAGEWWIATASGLCRFPKVSKPEELAHTPPKGLYTTRHGLAANVILRLFEDARGDIWIGSVGQGERLNGLSRWERSTGAFHHYSEKDYLPRLDTFYVSSFAEDRAGSLWIGFSGEGGLVRYRDGGFTLFTAKDGVPTGQIRNLLIDSAGRLWVPSYRGGLSRIEDPTAEHPTLVTYTTADGLSSNEITTVSEDQWGRIYIGTGRGIDRLDPATGHIKHYTTADGLPRGEIAAAMRDRRGALWFSFSSGLSRLVPEPDPPPVPPPILITGLRIAGEPHPISALGQSEIAPIELGAEKNQIQIDFVALSLSPGEGLRYQHQLEGSGQDWSPLTEHRMVNFANLAPGAYRFLVRAVNADGVASESSASFSFRILPPIWQRWWFLLLTAMSVGLATYALYRYRVARLLELERVRTRIATDLHDDIGSSLSQISVLSEVVHQRLGQDSRASEPLSLIAELSRGLMDSMSDIVWAINPHRDRLSDLTSRMRRFASDVFTAREIEFNFHAPGPPSEMKLGVDTRREVFLIFKESVNNLVRHSGCTKAEIKFLAENGHLMLNVNDNGQGFDPERASEGNGLQSMRQRANKIGGRLEVISSHGRGTTVTLTAPVKRR